jgi:flagellar hook-associated protein 3 FlgL
MISSVSTLAMRQAAMAAIGQAQSRLAQASEEVSTGRHHDVGLALGSAMRRSLDLHEVAGQIDTLTRANGLARSRLETTESALSEISDVASEFINQIVAFRNSGTDRSQILTDAQVRLDRLTSLLATTINGQSIFGGENTDSAALNSYLANPPSAARTAVINGFTAHFGFPPDDLQAASITPVQMNAYLDGDFAANFADPAWQANFSNASDAPLTDRIALNETIDTPVSANSTGVRKLVAALAAILDSGTERLNTGTFQSLIDRVAVLAGEARGEITKSQGIVGLNLDRITKANERLSLQGSLVARHLGGLEEVDTAEASVQLNLLHTKLEVSFAATARLQGLSLLNYL